MRTLVIGFLAILSCAMAAASPAQPGAAPDGRSRWRSEIERDSAGALGKAASAELRSAPTALLVRGPVSFPYMAQQPDGSWKPQRPSVAAAVRTGRGWIRLSAGGRRDPLDPSAARELDRLFESRALWAEPEAQSGCTDPSGILVLARHRRSERLSAFPCGFAGLTGRAARIVLDGRITDWSQVPESQRPAGLPLTRFDERTASSFRSASGLHSERLMAIRSEAEWLGQWRRITARQGNPPPLPTVDFRREMLLMAAMGPQPSGGYRAVIDKVLDQPGELLAFVRFISPGRKCGSIAAITSPVDVVRLPASARNVRWVVERQPADCP